MRPSPILVVGPSWVGDMVMAQSLLKLLKQRAAEAAIDVLAPAWALPLVARMPEVRRGILSATGHGEVALRTRWRLAKELRAAGYGRALVLPRSAKAALAPALARIPVRTGFRGEMRYGLINDMRPFDAAELDQTVKRFLALGLEPGEPLPAAPRPRLAVRPERQGPLMARLGLSPEGPAIAMMPGAEFGPAKCWPLEHYRALAGMLAAEGHEVWVLGSARDREAGEAIAADGSAINLCGRTELEDAVDLLDRCSHAVTNDSGLMHVAAAVGTRVVALYGSTTPRFTPPLAADAVVHYLDIVCSPCFQRRCPLGHLRCLTEIRPEAVLASIHGAAA